MMNAEVMAENRPDSPRRQAFRIHGREETHKNKSGVQIIIVPRQKIFVVFGGLLFELVVETSPGVGETILLQHRLQGLT